MKNYFYLLLATVCFGCAGGGSENEGMLHIRMDNLNPYPQQEKVILEELDVTIEPIRLETNEDCLLNKITQMLDEDYLWIVADRQIYKFDQQGKFVGKVGRKGQGPTEYVAPERIQLDSQNKIVYVMDYFGRKVMAYDYEGNFLRSQPLPEDYSLNRLLFDKGQLYYSSFNNSVMPDLLATDLMTGKTDTISYRERVMGSEGFEGETFFNKIGDKTYLYHYFNDTVYSVENKQLVPAYIFDLGENLLTFAQLTVVGESGFEEPIDRSKMRLSQFIDTEKYIFLSYQEIDSWQPQKEPDNRFAFYDKEKQLMVSDAYLVSEEEPAFSIEPTDPIFASSDGYSIFSYKQAYDLVEDNIFDNLLEDDNPVVFKYKFK